MIIDMEVDYIYSPGRPAPFVEDHDKSGFSDPGDEDYVEITGVDVLGFDITNIVYKTPALQNAIEEAIRDEEARR